MAITFQKLHVEATANVVAAARQANIRRYLHMSALEAKPAPVAGYHQTKQEAEELVVTSGLTYTIFRPSIIYGPGDAFINLFKQQIEKLRLVPVIGHGRYQLQPVPVWQVAQGFALALEKPVSENRSYDVGGPDPITFNDLIDTLARVLKKKAFKLHLPVWPLRLSAGLLQGYSWFPVTTDQITMLLVGNTCDPSAFFQDFGIKAVSLPRRTGRLSLLNPISQQRPSIFPPEGIVHEYTLRGVYSLVCCRICPAPGREFRRGRSWTGPVQP